MFQFAELQSHAWLMNSVFLSWLFPGRNALHHAVFQHLCRRFLDCLRLLRGASWLFFSKKKRATAGGARENGKKLNPPRIYI